MDQSPFGHYDSFGQPFKTKTTCGDVKKLLRGVACSIRLCFHLIAAENRKAAYDLELNLQ